MVFAESEMTGPAEYRRWGPFRRVGDDGVGGSIQASCEKDRASPKWLGSRMLAKATGNEGHGFLILGVNVKYFQIGFGILGLAAAGATVAEESIENKVERQLPAMVALYKELHAVPELSLQEQATAARVAKELQDAGYEVTPGVGGHGVVAVLQNGKGPTLMLRADMDALPIVEATGLDYASHVRAEVRPGEHVGVMHACGHDLHMANLIGTARILAADKGAWQGTLLVVFQPAEERVEGAQAMLDDGLFRRFPRPDMAFAFHVSPALPAGTIGYRAGYMMANSDSMDITIRGKGGHGAFPFLTIDPIVIAARLVLDLQTIVGRETDPNDPVVVTVGVIEGGTKHNIIPDECHLQLTIRTYRPEVRSAVFEAIRRKAEAAAASSHAPAPVVQVSDGTPALRNDEALTQRIVQLLAGELGEKQLREVAPIMGAEDFSQFGHAGIPVTMCMLGVIAPDRLAEYSQRGEIPPVLHSAKFYPDPEPSLRTGMRGMTATVMGLLPKP